MDDEPVKRVQIQPMSHAGSLFLLLIKLVARRINWKFSKYARSCCY